MNAKEKAKEIYCKYADALNIRDLQTTANPFVKQCALISVDEILNARPLDPNYVDWDDCGAAHQYWYEAQKEEALEFWKNVKSELQSL
jgi:hypothetical protein